MRDGIDSVGIADEEEPSFLAGRDDCLVAVPNAHAEFVAAEVISVGLSSGEYGGNGRRVTLSGTRNRSPGWCQPAPSHTTTACALGATRALISLSCSPIASELTVGMIIAAPSLRAWQIAPNR